ncbi:MAG: undecaprenyl/decaprenyl-phosphate alpha-N-acetylglucosaminyl 1-phosphate transferase [Chloroflexi bacterium]|nr:undecaprenyl/decaprenyl-phosphate alpha-N-acetylglucosaminyl 1-phosphate transferase [Chloroflexota bacterium]
MLYTALQPNYPSPLASHTSYLQLVVVPGASPEIGPLLLVFLVALLFSVLATPMLRRLAHRYNVLDEPSTRKIHTNPVPLLGGAAIYLSVIVGLVVFGQFGYVQQIATILIGATLMSMFGVWDDKWGLRPLAKLFGQILSASILFFSGVSVQFLHNNILNYIATVAWIVTITNAFNLMDNMDGLAGGIAAVAAVFFFLIATLTGQYLVAPLAAVILGACIGFLFYNFNPASIFMGDTGSLFLGFMLAAVGVKLRFPPPYSQDIVTWMVPVLVLGVPLFDTVLVTLSRLRRGVPISRGGKDHFSHRLVALGLTRRESVLVLYLVQGALGVAALVVMQATILEGYILGFVIFICAIVMAYKLEQLDLSETNPAPPGAPAPVRLSARFSKGRK